MAKCYHKITISTLKAIERASITNQYPKDIQQSKLPVFSLAIGRILFYARNIMRSEEEIKHEILEIHVLFQEWYQGSLPDSDLDSKIGIRLAEDFQITFPDGTVHAKNDLLKMMRPDRGNDPQYRIVIGYIQMKSSSADTYHVAYIESQHWYGAEKPNLIIETSSILRDSPNGLLWASIHETKVD